jgi:putative tryptophan/tyrosine transport system substrate-binding protein
MKRILSFLALCSLLLAPRSAVDAQQPKKIFRIGFLDQSTASGMAVLLDTFRQELIKLGWVEGKNIGFEYRFAEQQNERLPALAAELVRLKLDVILAMGQQAASAAKSATASIPIVMATAGSPVAGGLVKSLARPGGNVTGLSSLAPELNSKRLEILRDAVPKLSRVGFLQASGTSATPQMAEVTAASTPLEVKLEMIETQLDAKSLERAFQSAKRNRLDALITAAGRQFFAERKTIVELARRHRLPTIYPQREYVDEGGLMFYGVDFEDLLRKSAHYLDKILKGAKPADLPVQQASKFEFIINLKAAKQIGLTIPVRVLERANQVIK